MKRKKSNRLYVTGWGETLKHHLHIDRDELASSLPLEEASSLRIPNPDDLRLLWRQLGLSQFTAAEVARKFDVSRQAVLVWREKAGITDEHVQSKKRAEKKAELTRILQSAQSVAEAAKLAGVSFGTAYRVAEKLGLEFVHRGKKRPSDAEIVKLAEGKTWRELADACGLKLQTLRHYVYGNEKLFARIKRKIKRQSTGQEAHGKIDVDKLVELHNAGASAYQIACHFGVETPSAVYWIKKLELKKKGDSNANNAA